MTLNAPVQERRKFPRSDAPVRFGISLLRPQGLIPASSINLSEGGLCVRLDEMEDTLEVRSLVRLQLTPTRSQRSVECTGRVAWVVQRLDLRSTPPFPFDVGIELVDPPSILRPFIVQRSGITSPKARGVQEKRLEPAVIRGRQFLPRLERQANHPLRWHLIVSVDGAPCFSGHYPSDRAAMAAWATFKRRQTRR